MGKDLELTKQFSDCILGSALLALLNTPLFSHAKLGIFPSGYGGHIFGEVAC
ncbi:hypothetical protein [Salinibacillus kushneri]|uniref:hypothetical protein n=1 Tax=Salinibacillus kushneri TaxID=237682 RepID=UPI001C65EC6C|nr:hypothetical protein [Salinibacillus kushneri]